MKALLLCQNLRVGGAEELILGTSTRLPDEGVETGVVAITERGPIAEEIAGAGVPVQLARGEPGPRDPLAFVRLVRLLQLEQPDVVHTFLLNAGLYGRLAAIAAGVPLILAAEQNLYKSKKRRHAVLERVLAARTFRIVACCHTVGEFYRRQVGVTPGKIAVIYNAVSFDQVPAPEDRERARRGLGLPLDAQVLGTVGRLTQQKGHRVLLQALAQLAPRFPALVLAVAGEGPLASALEAEAEELGMQERVRFLGVRRDRQTLYAAMDAFVLPSLWEGLSLALIEAMGAARPIVATTVGGNPEVVDHGRSGLLVPPGDPNSLSNALEALLADADLRQRLGAAACYEARARFSIDQHVRQVAGLYRQGLGERVNAEPAGTGAGA